MAGGRILPVNMPVTQEGIDVRKNRASYITLVAVVSLAGFLEGMVGGDHQGV